MVTDAANTEPRRCDCPVCTGLREAGELVESPPHLNSLDVDKAMTRLLGAALMRRNEGLTPVSLQRVEDEITLSLAVLATFRQLDDAKAIGEGADAIRKNRRKLNDQQQQLKVLGSKVEALELADKLRRQNAEAAAGERPFEHHSDADVARVADQPGRYLPQMARHEIELRKAEGRWNHNDAADCGPEALADFIGKASHLAPRDVAGFLFSGDDNRRDGMNRVYHAVRRGLRNRHHRLPLSEDCADDFARAIVSEIVELVEAARRFAMDEAKK